MVFYNSLKTIHFQHLNLSSTQLQVGLKLVSPSAQLLQTIIKRHGLQHGTLEPWSSLLFHSCAVTKWDMGARMLHPMSEKN